MKWINFAVKADFSWPNRPVEFLFERKRIVLQPLTEELSCTASLFDPNGTSFEIGGTILSRFLSRLAWSKHGGIEEHFAVGSNHPDNPGRLGRGTYSISAWENIEPWSYLYFPSSTKADLALGLFREGLTINSISMSFLSFFKILNINLKTGGQQKEWINRHIHHIKFPEIDRLNHIKSNTCDIGDYLYKQGRCSVAHAYGSPIVHPDYFNDKQRLRNDLPLIKRIAELYIEIELGVLSDSSFWESARNDAGLHSEVLTPKLINDNRVQYSQLKPK